MIGLWLQLLTDIQCSWFGGKCFWRKLCWVFHGHHLLRSVWTTPTPNAWPQPMDVHEKRQTNIQGGRVTPTTAELFWKQWVTTTKILSSKNNHQMSGIPSPPTSYVSMTYCCLSLLTSLRFRCNFFLGFFCVSVDLLPWHFLIYRMYAPLLFQASLCCLIPFLLEVYKMCSLSCTQNTDVETG